MNESSAPFHRINKVLRTALLLGSVILVCVLSFYLAVSSYTLAPPLGSADLSALLFGAASLSFFMFSVLIAAWAAFFSNNTVQEVVHKAIEAQMNTKIKLLENELRGRVLSVLGHLNGETSIDPETLKTKDPERLAEAVRLCEQGYNFLREVKGKAEYMGLNNFVFYASVLGDRTRGADMLQKAKDLSEAAREHNSTNLRLTACRAILEFSSDAVEREKAIETLKNIANAPEYSDVSKKERKEAKIHMASLTPNVPQEEATSKPSEPTPMDLSKNHPSGEPPSSQI